MLIEKWDSVRLVEGGAMNDIPMDGEHVGLTGWLARMPNTTPADVDGSPKIPSHAVGRTCRRLRGPMRENPATFRLTLLALRLVIPALGAVGSGPRAYADDAVCAEVRLEIQQRMVITRTALRATLQLNNGTDSDYLEQIRVTLNIRDLDGQPTNNRFNYQTLELDGISAVDGTGILPPASSCTAAWTLIPYHEAAPTAPTEYDVGGTLEYVQGDSLIVTHFFPVRITVVPDPILHVKYFWERDVIADDPFTPNVVEPAQPFSLGLLIHNSGAGSARNMRITSSQPRIVDNQRGLLINFQMIGTQVNGQTVSPSLTVNFGDLAPGRTAIARFLMTSTLQGHFTQYEASYEHVTGLGDPRLSLIDSLDIFELIHCVRVTTPTDDGLPDFLVNRHTWYDLPPEPWEDPRDPREDPNDPERRNLPDRVYLSDGTFAFVTSVLDGIVVTPDGPNHRAFVHAPQPGGWVYLKFADPFEGQYRLVGVERSNGSQLLLDDPADGLADRYNAWQTDRVFVTGAPAIPAHHIHLFDYSGDGQYVLYFEPDNVPPTAAWRSYASHSGELGAQLPLNFDQYGMLSEPRGTALRMVVALFSEPIRSETFSLVSVRGLAGPDGTEVSIDPNSIHLTLSTDRLRGEILFDPPLPDFAKYCIRLIGVTDMAGNVLQNSQVVITMLQGDATGDHRVNNTDVGAVSSLVGTDPIDPLNPRHLRSDVNLDGKIDMADVNIVLAARGRDARALSPCLRDEPGPKAEPMFDQMLDGRPAPDSAAAGTYAVSWLNDPRTFVPEPEVVGPRDEP